MAKPFISKDGTDSDGIRAEVYVETGTGTVNKIEPHDNGTAVSVSIKNSNPKVKYPSAGWINSDDPLFQLVQDAHESGREITYRIESQRKSHVDRTLPIAPLRANTEIAKENVVRVFAALDGTLSLEAVTNPAEDPTSSGRIRATPTPTPTAPQFTEPNLTPQKPQNPLPNPTNEQAPQQTAPHTRTAVTEAVPWEYYNSDGTINFGSMWFTAASQAERFIRENITAHEGKKSKLLTPTVDIHVNALTRGLLSVMDAVAISTQKIVYNQTLSPSWRAQFHARIRGIVYDTIENYFPLPFGNRPNPEFYQKWFNNVYETSLKRFLLIYSIVTNTTHRTPTTLPPLSETVAINTYIPPLFIDPTPAGEELVEEFKNLVLNTLKIEPQNLNKVSTVLEYLYGTPQAKDVPAPLLNELIKTINNHPDPAEKFNELSNTITRIVKE